MRLAGRRADGPARQHASRHMLGRCRCSASRATLNRTGLHFKRTHIDQLRAADAYLLGERRWMSTYRQSNGTRRFCGLPSSLHSIFARDIPHRRRKRPSLGPSPGHCAARPSARNGWGLPVWHSCGQLVSSEDGTVRSCCTLRRGTPVQLFSLLFGYAQEQATFRAVEPPSWTRKNLRLQW